MAERVLGRCECVGGPADGFAFTVMATGSPPPVIQIPEFQGAFLPPPPPGAASVFARVHTYRLGDHDERMALYSHESTRG